VARVVSGTRLKASFERWLSTEITVSSDQVVLRFLNRLSICIALIPITSGNPQIQTHSGVRCGC
jgi:hypothetical protein